MLNAALFTSSAETWGTPQPLFDALDAEFQFELDAAALPASAKCRNFYTPKEDGLSQPWARMTFLNPPYGRSIKAWVAKAYQETKRGNTTVALLPVRSDTVWWHSYVMKAAEIRLLTRRLSFEGGDNKAPMPCAVVIFRPGNHTPTLSAQAA